LPSNEEPGAERDTAGEVARLYADHPYPDHGIVSSSLARMATGLVAPGRATRILDAGCGTGEQTLGIARAYPSAEVIGVDVSAASIARAREHGDRHGIRATFAVRDLLEPLDDLGTFDLIVSVGVLHHLDDPVPALRNLANLAAPDAVLLGMVYGSFGRTELFAARDGLRLLAEHEGTRDDVLEALGSLRWSPNHGVMHYADVLRRRLRFGPDIDWWEAVRRVARGRSRSYQADAFTNPQELSFTWAELGATIARAGWELTGWPARSGMPDDPKSLLREPAASALARRSLLDRAAVYERIVQPSNLYFTAKPALTA
jgi:SAM-dependent methyltransferase